MTMFLYYFMQTLKMNIYPEQQTNDFRVEMKTVSTTALASMFGSVCWIVFSY